MTWFFICGFYFTGRESTRRRGRRSRQSTSASRRRRTRCRRRCGSSCERRMEDASMEKGPADDDLSIHSFSLYLYLHSFLPGTSCPGLLARASCPGTSCPGFVPRDFMPGLRAPGLHARDFVPGTYSCKQTHATSHETSRPRTIMCTSPTPARPAGSPPPRTPLRAEPLPRGPPPPRSPPPTPRRCAAPRWLSIPRF